MNTKTAKALRAVANHHHSVPFKYQQETRETARKDTPPCTIVDPNSTKGQYRALKKKYKAQGHI